MTWVTGDPNAANRLTLESAARLNYLLQNGDLGPGMASKIHYHNRLLVFQIFADPAKNQQPTPYVNLLDDGVRMWMGREREETSSGVKGDFWEYVFGDEDDTGQSDDKQDLPQPQAPGSAIYSTFEGSCLLYTSPSPRD